MPLYCIISALSPSFTLLHETFIQNVLIVMARELRSAEYTSVHAAITSSFWTEGVLVPLQVDDVSEIACYPKLQASARHPASLKQPEERAAASRARSSEHEGEQSIPLAEHSERMEGMKRTLAEKWEARAEEQEERHEAEIASMRAAFDARADVMHRDLEVGFRTPRAPATKSSSIFWSQAHLSTATHAAHQACFPSSSLDQPPSVDSRPPLRLRVGAGEVVSH